MLICHSCSFECKSLKDLFRHLKQKHGLHGRYGGFECGQHKCNRKYHDKYALTRHLKSDHPGDIESDCADSSKHLNTALDCAASATSTLGEMDYECSGHNDDTDAASGDLHDGSDCLDDLEQMAAEFICRCKSTSVSLTAVNDMVSSCSLFVESVVDSLQKQVTSVLKQSVATNFNINMLDDVFSKYRQPFKSVDTAYKQNKYWKERGCLIEPKEYTIGYHQSFKVDKNTGMSVPETVQVTGQYIPLREMLQAYLKDNNKAVIATSHPSKNEDCLCNYLDGQKWQDYQDKDNVVLLRFYGDDFEPANPLGSRKSLYKIGTIYYQCEGFPTEMLTKTENSLMALCYYADDVKEFGWKQVLKPFLDELRSLEETGFDLTIDGKVSSFKVAVSTLTGDNLFLNSILGYVESFSANYPCRHCLVEKRDFSTTFVEDSTKVRTCDNYDSSISDLSISTTGIKENSALNVLSSFHAATNYVQDVMHDVFEGVCLYDMKLICSQLINDGIFTLNDMNSRVQSFNYGYYDVGNKPPVITKAHLDAEQLSMEAVQAWCFVRIFSFAVGDLVPRGNKYWQLYILLRQIMDIICAPYVHRKEIDLLRVLIKEYLTMRMELFADVGLKNKHHHLVHYPRLIEQVGPLSRFWCLRFEAKHQRAKKLIHLSGNFKNVPKSIASRHQLDVAFKIYYAQSNPLSNSLIDKVIGPGRNMMLSELSEGTLINEAIGCVGLYTELSEVHWIEYKGIRYKPGCILVMEIDDNLPSFLHVSVILVSGQQAWLVGHLLESVSFDEHFQAWLVKPSLPKKWASCNPVRLIYPFPVNYCERCADNSELMISLKYRL